MSISASGERRCAHSTSWRSTGPNGGPTGGAALTVLLPERGPSLRRRTALSPATQSARSSRIFQSRPSSPPGLSTLATSGTASAGSTQCHAWATSTASTLQSGSGIRSPVPASTRMPGTARRSCLRMPSDGSTAVTSRPRPVS